MPYYYEWNKLTTKPLWIKFMGKRKKERADTDYDYDWYVPIEYTIKKCLHKGCSECNGTGKKKDGSLCTHMISCSCPRCNPINMSCTLK